MTHNVLGFSIGSKNKQIFCSLYCETRLEDECDDTEETESSVMRVEGIVESNFQVRHVWIHFGLVKSIQFRELNVIYKYFNKIDAFENLCS